MQQNSECQGNSSRPVRGSTCPVERHPCGRDMEERGGDRLPRSWHTPLALPSHEAGLTLLQESPHPFPVVLSLLGQPLSTAAVRQVLVEVLVVGFVNHQFHQGHGVG